ncbi:hypothetical protein IDAT_08480 [Pseudidiomarina atlantica]|uniref:Uncharacterized protein n=1 Tax=Pseudidiomarina atlantica TaxID=1517416 RepID=A0A094J707_9GAMM|nr:DUF5676 family membrane protein [Pseudidiomarina atlantica]KFZ28341.1 hypothetical protein IDAT_08480 [Pseudidiomarina atlantica]
MKLNAKKFGLAAGGAFAVLWGVCSLLVLIMPSSMMALTEGMVHGKLSGFEWHVSFSGFVTGLFGWSLGAMITGWLIVTLYNKQMKTAK